VTSDERKKERRRQKTFSENETAALKSLQRRCSVCCLTRAVCGRELLAVAARTRIVRAEDLISNWLIHPDMFRFVLRRLQRFLLFILRGDCRLVRAVRELGSRVFRRGAAELGALQPL
jgi:hypothetical protein